MSFRMREVTCRPAGLGTINKQTQEGLEIWVQLILSRKHDLLNYMSVLSVYIGIPSVI
jgi:hypothetical protein